MRPVRLTVQGLHSYSEPVVVDFANLGEFGLFGIFGPIGSGKSTLLDAMTLALYGQVDRIQGRSRKGLLNPRCKRIEVKFRFSVARASEPGRDLYEVQRSYRPEQRTGTVQTSMSRLSLLRPEGPVPLADKEGAVNREVEGILGLNAQDFMRAVVLPQGRFMQFLHLKGKERRVMLQRLFRLGAWGQGLRDQVRVRRSRVSSALERAEGELAGLGDASAEAVCLAQQAVDEAAEADRVAREQAATAASAHARAMQVRDQQARLTQLRQELSQHSARAGEMAALSEQVGLATRAAPVVSPARRATANATANEAAERAAEAARATAANRLQALETALSASQDQTSRFHEEEPRLRAEIGQLEQAVQLHGELREADAVAAKLQARVTDLSKQVEEKAMRIQAADQEHTELQGRRQLVAEEYAACQTPSEERDRILAAVRARDAVDHVRGEVTALRTALSELKKQRSSAADALAALTDEQAAATATVGAVEVPEAPDEAALDAQADQLTRCSVAVARWVQLRDAVRVAKAALSGEHEALAVARTAHEAAEAALATARQQATEVAAGVLAQQLLPGESCPVCGSHDHPHPAPVVEHDDVLGTAIANEATARERRAAAERSVEKAIDALSRTEDAWHELELPEPVRAAPQQALLDLTAAHEAARAAVVAAREAHARAEQQRTAARDAEQRLAGPLAAARVQLEAVEARIAETSEALATREAEEGRAWAELDEHRGDLTVFEIPGRFARLQRLDQRAAELFPELQRLEAALTTAAAQHQALEVEHHALAQQHVQVGERLASTEAIRVGLRKQIGTWTDDKAPHEALSSRQQALDALRRSSREAVALADQAREASAQAAQVLAAAEATATSAAQAADAAAEELSAALELSGFPSVEEALAASMPAADLAAARQAVKTFSDRHGALEEAVATATADLGDAALSDEEFAAAEQGLAATRQAAEQSLARLSEAQFALKRLEERAARFAALTAQVDDLAVTAQRLDTLSHLIRGNRFVEFLANDYLAELAREASLHLQRLTNHRYELALDADGTFLIRDSDSGGSERPVTSLSGGETFLTSLALALALSNQVQVRGTQALEFFFLDEGFGSLDANALDRVMTAIDGLASTDRMIGLISHVEGVRERVPRYLQVTGNAEGVGSRVEVVDN